MYVLSVALVSKNNIAVKNESDQQVSLMQIIMPSVVFKCFYFRLIFLTII